MLMLMLVAVALTLPQYFQSHMVLQSEPERACLWGWARPGAIVAVKATIPGESGWSGATATAGSGEWQICLSPQPASAAPASIRVSEAGGGANSIAELSDVLFGHVYLCSGQSNMQATVAGVINATAECAAATKPTLRTFTVRPGGSSNPRTDLFPPLTNWSAASPETICPPLVKPYTPYSLFGSGGSLPGYTGISAVCYFFGRDLHAALGGTTPIGLIHSSVGGTQVQSWMASPPGGLWNAMIRPLVHSPIKGIVWVSRARIIERMHPLHEHAIICLLHSTKASPTPTTTRPMLRIRTAW